MAKSIRFKFPVNVGLHARPASMLQDLAGLYLSEFTFINERNGRKADPKSIVQLISSDTKKDDLCVMEIKGDDEETALGAFEKLITSGLHKCNEEDSEPVVRPALDSVVIPRAIASKEVTYQKGKSAVRGIAFGKAFVVTAGGAGSDKPPLFSKDVGLEWRLINEAVSAVTNRLKTDLASSKSEVESKITKAHLSIISDPVFNDKIRGFIKRDSLTAYHAVKKTGAYFAETLQASENIYLRERALDLMALSERILDAIYGTKEETRGISLSEPSIIIAKNLPPSVVISLRGKNLTGIVLEDGGITSHTIILARSFGIPTVVNLSEAGRTIENGAEIILDGTRGLVIEKPDQKVKGFYLAELRKEEEKMNAMEKFVHITPTTKDGKVIEVGANISTSEEAESAFRQGALGIGLFRTEMLFVNRRYLPTEDEQFEAYVKVAKAAGARPVIIRTLDAGGDKPIPSLTLPTEENPFLGYRAVRIYGDHKELIRTQLRAILRASAFGNIKIMFPMISCVEEVRDLKTLISKIKSELTRQGIPYKEDIETGIMIEIPATAFIIDELSSEVDFFSIGTNDLAQYFLAVDRNNKKVGHLYNTIHPSFLRFLKKIVEEIHNCGKWVGLCGEMGGSIKQLPLLIGLGLDEISVQPNMPPLIKKYIASVSRADCETLFEEAAAKPDIKGVDSILTQFEYDLKRGDIITKELIKIGSTARTKEEAIRELVDILDMSGRLEDAGEVEDAIWRRENVHPTGIGFGMAIPHCKSSSVKQSSIALIKFKEPIEWKSFDGQQVNMAFLFAVDAAGYEKDHLKTLARFARGLMSEEFRGRLASAEHEDRLVDVIREFAN